MSRISSVGSGNGYVADYKAADPTTRLLQGLPVDESEIVVPAEYQSSEPPIVEAYPTTYEDPTRAVVNLQGGSTSVDGALSAALKEYHQAEQDKGGGATAAPAISSNVDQALRDALAEYEKTKAEDGQTEQAPAISSNVDQALRDALAEYEKTKAEGGSEASEQPSSEEPSDDAKAKGKETVDAYVFAASTAPIKATTIPKYKDPTIEGQVDVRDVASLFNGVNFDTPKTASAQTFQLKNGGGIPV